MARRRRGTIARKPSASKTSRGRAAGWRLVAFLAAVFAVKVVALTQLQDHPLLAPDAGLDTASYVQLARRVLGGDLALGPGLYYLSPLYIYFLAATLAVSDSFTFVRTVQVALGTAAVGFVFGAARIWFGVRAAWIAAILAALTGVFTFYEIVLLQSSLDAVLTAASLYCFSRGISTRDGAAPQPLPPMIVAGVLFGLQILNRPNVAIAIGGVIVVLLVMKRWRAGVVIAAGVLAALAPVLIRNAIVSGHFALASSHGGLNFYIGNHAAATGQYVAVPGVRANIEGQSEDTRRVAQAATGRPLSDSDVSAYFTGLAADWIRRYPGAAAKLFVKKLALVFSARHQWLDFSYPYYAHDAGTILRFLFVGPWLLVPLGIAGLVVAWPRGRPEYFAYAAFVPFYAIGVAIFFVAERYRLPVFVPLCVVSGGALDWAAEAFRKRASHLAPRTSISAAAAIVLAAGAVTFWPFDVSDGRFDERLRLAKVLMNQRNYDAAVMELQAAHDLNPSHTVAQFNLGMALVSSGRGEEGIAHLRRAVDAGVPQKGARYAMVGAMLATGDRDNAVALLRTYFPAPEDDAESCYRVGLLAMDAGAPRVAERYLLRALQLRPGWPEALQALQQLGR